MSSLYPLLLIVVLRKWNEAAAGETHNAWPSHVTRLFAGFNPLAYFGGAFFKITVKIQTNSAA